MLLSNLDRQVLSVLKDGALGRPKPGPRLAVLGNCQSFDVAYAMKLLDPAATVHHYPIQGKAKISGKMLVRALRDYDHVFLQDFGDGFVRGASSAVLCNELRSTTKYPSLLFGAYHPDSIFVSAGTNAFIAGPIGQHHSALALFAYRAGITPDGASRLYRRDVYEMLGYFDLWQPATAQFLEHTKSYGLQLEADFIRWTRRGCFMYSVNHPKSFVLFDLARHLLDEAGRSARPIDFEHYSLNDLARDTVFPVYPDIAEHFGVSGSYLFKAPKHSPGGLSLGNFWDLPGFITESYRVYARRAPGELANERVQAWLDNGEVSSVLKEFCLPASGRGARSNPAPALRLTPAVA